MALLAGAVAGAATAGVSPERELRARETAAVAGMRAFIVRCIPSVAARSEIVTTGLRRASAETEAAVLMGQDGLVWMSRDLEVLLVAFEDVPVCRVIVPNADPAVVTDLVLGVFREQDSAFRIERFNFKDAGGFDAVYTSNDPGQELVIRITSGTGETGAGFALFTVERNI